MSSQAAPPSGAPVRVDGTTGPSHSNAARALRELLADPGAEPAAFDEIATSRPEVWAPATVLAALARIARATADETVESQLRAVAERTADLAEVQVARRLPVTIHTLAAHVGVASAAGLDSEVLALTHGVDDVDDITALMVVYRAVALARTGLEVAAERATGRVLGSRRRHPGIRTFARHLRDTGALVTRRDPAVIWLP